MKQPRDSSFDDPALKAALRRVIDPREAAPAALRDRLAAMAKRGVGATGQQDRKEDAANKPIPFRRSPLYKLAVAAILVIGFGALGYQIWQMNQPRVGYDGTIAFSNSIIQPMVDAHAARVKAGAAAGDTITSLTGANALAGQLGRPVLVADLTKEGWTFVGGAVRKVGSDQAAQLYFTKGKSAISVFSLPATAAPDAKDGESYDATLGGQYIAGIKRNGRGLFCIVGSSEDRSITIDDVKRLLDKHKDELSGV